MEKRKKGILKVTLTLLIALLLALSVLLLASADADVPEGGEATLAIKKGGFTVETKSGSFDELMSYINGESPQATANAAYIITLKSDAAVLGYYEFRDLASSASITIDINGYTVTAPKGGAIIQMRSSYELIIDGANDLGERGKWITPGSVAAMVYVSPTGDLYTTDNAVARISDLDIVATNMSNSGHSVINVGNGSCYVNNVNITYTGEDCSSVGTDNKNLIKISKGNLYVNNCELIDTNERGIKTCGIVSTAAKSGRVVVADTKISTYIGISSTSYENEITSCDISTVSYAYYERGRFIVTDTKTETSSAFFVQEDADVKLCYGTGGTTVKISEGAQIRDALVFDEGYCLVPDSEGGFAVGKCDGYATVSLPRIFGDGMVLQRGEPINVFGYCMTEGAEIVVELAGSVERAVVEGGEWFVTFPKMEAAYGLTLTVRENATNTRTLVYTDVAIGDVFVISGQSNAAFQTYKMEDADEYIARADDYPNIRVFRQMEKSSIFEQPYGFGGWYVASAENIMRSGAMRGDVSAVGYVAATRIAAALGEGVPVAMIDATYGGSGIYTWIDIDRFKYNFAGYSTGVDNQISIYDEYVKFIKENGREPISSDELYCYVEKVYSSVPSVNYNTMVAPLVGYTAKAVIWYQGEANLGLKSNYVKFFEIMKESFAEAFANDSLSFFVIQLAPYGKTDTSEFRAGQYLLSDVENTYLISAATEGAYFSYDEFTYDSTGMTFIHPSRKSPIGQRAALSILKNLYGLYEDEVVTAPRILSVTAEGSELVITFDSELGIFFADTLSGFEIAGRDGVFKIASAKISGNTVRLKSSAVAAPSRVRYGFGRMMIELEDGRLVEFVDNTWDGMDASLVVDSDGSIVRIEADSGVVIRSRFPGNLTNASGIPMPTFMLEAGYEAKIFEE